MDAQTQREPDLRQGPRPLALHLTLTGLTWMSSLGALPLLRNGSLPLRDPGRDPGRDRGKDRGPAAAKTAKPNPSDAPEPLARLEQLARHAPADLQQALRGEILRRSATLIEAIERYRKHPYRRDLPDPPVLWRDGTTRVLHFEAPAKTKRSGPPLFLVPSLINRAYILDLAEETSLLRWLAKHGQECFLVDWDAPGEVERGFTLTDYIAGRLEAALDQVIAETGQAPVVAGYCMGGLLALALALRRQADLAGLVLMATPWDFHADDQASAQMLSAALVTSAPLLELLGEMPVDLIQALFTGLDPLTAPRKFLAFGRFPEDSSKARRFVALEDWLNDGVPLAAPVARECLGGWYGENTPARGRWRIAGRPVDPGALDLPTLCLVPGQDRIVPPPSALALGEAIPGAEIQRPSLGHIGMVVAGRAPETVWHPLLTWVKERKARPA